VQHAILAAGLRQAVGAFDTVHITAFQGRVDAFGSVVEGLSEQGAPAYFLAGDERFAERARSGELAAHPARDPAVGVIERPRRADEVQDGVRDVGARQLPGRLGISRDPAGPMNDHSRDLPPPSRIVFVRHGYVDLGAWRAGQAV
jgi:hypothetical protein